MGKGLTKSGRELNPVDQWRKKKHKEDLEKIKQQRDASKKNTLEKKTAQQIQTDLERIRRGGQLSQKLRGQKEKLEKRLNRLISEGKYVPNEDATPEAMAELAKNVRRGRKYTKPEDSPWYDPHLNPKGIFPIDAPDDDNIPTTFIPDPGDLAVMNQLYDLLMEVIFKTPLQVTLDMPDDLPVPEGVPGAVPTPDPEIPIMFHPHAVHYMANKPVIVSSPYDSVPVVIRNHPELMPPSSRTIPMPVLPPPPGVPLVPMGMGVGRMPIVLVPANPVIKTEPEIKSEPSEPFGAPIAPIQPMAPVIIQENEEIGAKRPPPPPSVPRKSAVALGTVVAKSVNPSTSVVPNAPQQPSSSAPLIPVSVLKKAKVMKKDGGGVDAVQTATDPDIDQFLSSL